MKSSIFVLCSLLVLAGWPASAYGARQLSATTGILPQPQATGLTELGTVNTLASKPVLEPVAQAPAAAPAAALLSAQAPAPVPVAEAVVAAQAPASMRTPASAASYSGSAPAPGPSPARRQRITGVYILDADYATLTIPDPDQPDQGNLMLSGFSRHVSHYTATSGAGVSSRGRLPITDFSNITFPSYNASTNGTGDSVAPNAALYSNSGGDDIGSDRLLRLITLEGKPTVDDTNSTLTFNVTVSASSDQDDTVTVYDVSYNATNNGTDMPQVTEEEYGTTTTFQDVALYVGKYWWGMDNDAANVRRREQRREEQAAADSFFFP